MSREWGRKNKGHLAKNKIKAREPLPLSNFDAYMTARTARQDLVDAYDATLAGTDAMKHDHV